MKTPFCILLVIVLAMCGCTGRSNESELPDGVINLIIQESDLDLQSEVARSYLNGSALPFIKSTMFDSSLVFIVSDSTGHLSGASGITHWIILQRGSHCTLLKEVYGTNFEFQKGNDTSFADIVFDYGVLGGPLAEYRRSSFSWDGSNYWLKDILSINGDSNDIPVEILAAINYRFTNFELENPPYHADDIIIDSLTFEASRSNKSGDTLYILSYHSPFHECTSWLFQNFDSSYVLFQKLNDCVYCDENSSNQVFDLKIGGHDIADSILSEGKHYIWNGMNYQLN